MARSIWTILKYFHAIGVEFIQTPEYHRLIKLPFGFSIIGENVPKNNEGHSESSLIGLATLNIFHNIVTGFGPGLGFEKGHSTKLFGRLAAGYIFIIGKDIEVTPNVNLDFPHKSPHQFIYGVTLGKQF